MRVLHVVECLGGGVSSVIAEHVRATPHVDHHLVAAERPQHSTGFRFVDEVASLTVLSGSRARDVADTDRAVRRLKPDLVHAHSSFGGVYARLAPSAPTRRILYTPHCYAFERTDQPYAVRRAYHAAERALARRTGAVVAISPREADLARRLHPDVPVHHVPNTVTLPAGLGRTRTDRFEVVAAGRLMAQKSPDFFADAVALGRRADPSIHWAWLGDGDARYRARLQATGAEVSGWVPRERILERLAASSVYVHTASWEGSPITLLEAAGLGVPQISRRIPALEALDVPGLVESPGALVERVLALKEQSAYDAGVAQSRSLADRHRSSDGSTSIGQAYAEALGAAA